MSGRIHDADAATPFWSERNYNDYGIESKVRTCVDVSWSCDGLVNEMLQEKCDVCWPACCSIVLLSRFLEKGFSDYVVHS